MKDVSGLGIRGRRTRRLKARGAIRHERRRFEAGRVRRNDEQWRSADAGGRAGRGGLRAVHGAARLRGDGCRSVFRRAGFFTAPRHAAPFIFGVHGEARQRITAERRDEN